MSLNILSRIISKVRFKYRNCQLNERYLIKVSELMTLQRPKHKSKFVVGTDEILPIISISIEERVT